MANHRLVVHWPRLGPLHLARMEATHRYFAERGAEVNVLETAPRDRLYAWREETAPQPFKRVQIFPDQIYEDIAGPTMRRGTMASLDAIDPTAVAISSYSTPDARAAMEWCRRSRRIAILMYESRREDAIRSGMREQIKNVLVRQFDSALVSGTPQRRYLKELGFPEELTFFTASAIDNEFFRRRAEDVRSDPEQARHLPGLADPAPYFLTSNRFIERKNLPMLLKAYAAYRQRAERPWRLVLLGDGPQRDLLERIVNEGSIDGVVFAGFQQIQDLPAYYALAGAYVHPATVDQWGLVVNEAMAAGLPVAVSQGAGCSEDLVSEGENGYVFAPDDERAITEILLRLSAPDRDRDAMGRRSKAIVDGFSPAVFARGLWSAMEAGLARSGRGLDIPGRALLAALRLTQRHPRSFHTVES